MPVGGHRLTLMSPGAGPASQVSILRQPVFFHLWGTVFIGAAVNDRLNFEVSVRRWRRRNPFQRHVHVGGRGGAFMQVEMKDIDSGTKTNQRIRTEDKVERAFVEPREMQYLYHDGTGYVFMYKESY